jgi:hypothetical protein
MERKIKEKNPSVLPLLKIIIKELLASNEYVHSDKDTLTRVKEDEEQKIYQNFSSEDLREFYPEVSQLIVNKVIDDVLVKSDSWESERLRFREVSVTKKMRNKLIELKKQNDEKLQKDIMNLIESDTDVKNTPPEEKEVFLLFLGEGLIGLEDLK